MMTNQEKNEAVARKLGWTEELCGKPNAHTFFGQKYSEVCDCGNIQHSIPDYCGSIEAAWEIVARDQNHFIVYFEDGEWFAGYWCSHFGDAEGAYAPTAPMAIVDAFLKLP